MQGAADAAAYSALIAQSAGGNIVTEARSITAKYKFQNGANGTTVTVNQPPKSGPYSGNAAGVEVIIAQPQTKIFSGLFFASAAVVRARAVAIPSPAGGTCVQSLDTSNVNGIYLLSSAAINVQGCNVQDNAVGSGSMLVTTSASITADTVSAGGTIADLGSITTAKASGPAANARPVADPYANVSMPHPPSPGCTVGGYVAPAVNLQFQAATQLSPGTYCNGMDFPSGAYANLAPGIYYVEGGSFHVEANASVSGTGVTVVLTSSPGGSDYATVTVDGNNGQQGGSLQLTAPNSGATAGIALFGDRNAPSTQIASFGAASTVTVGGAIYFPSQQISFGATGGNTSVCTAMIGYDIMLLNSALFASKCTAGQLPATGPAARLVE
jgi:hypothetical protein